MIKAIAIDDEPIALEVMRSMMDKVTFVDISKWFSNAFEAIHYLQENKVDLIFLDISMPDLTGIDFVKGLSKTPMIIFTTAYTEHALEGFELNAIDYLLKPFSLARFIKACNKANEQYQLRIHSTSTRDEPPHFFIKSGYEQIKVNPEEILFAEGNGNYVNFVTSSIKIASRLTMTEAENLLPMHLFVRTHRSYIINKKHIRKIDKRSVWIMQHEVPIGPAYQEPLTAALK